MAPDAAIAPTNDFYESLERLPETEKNAVLRVWPCLGQWIDEHPERVVARGGGFVYRHPEPRVEITYCVSAKTGRIHPTWTSSTLKRRLLIFLSYCHEDKEWPPRLEKFLKDLEAEGHVQHWIDKAIAPGQIWRVAIDEALSGASIAVLLVTQDFLASNFIRQVELPQLLESFVKGRLDLNWIPVRPSTVDETALMEIQALGNVNAPLSTLAPAELDQQLVQIFKKLKSVCERQGVSFKAAKLPEIG